VTDRRVAEIEHGDVLESTVEEAVDQSRRPTTDVQDRGIAAEFRSLDEPE
jgi:hypothetical protein